HLLVFFRKGQSDVCRNCRFSFILTDTGNQQHLVSLSPHMVFYLGLCSPAGLCKIHTHQRRIQQKGLFRFLPSKDAFTLKGNGSPNCSIQKPGCRIRTFHSKPKKVEKADHCRHCQHTSCDQQISPCHDPGGVRRP